MIRKQSMPVLTFAILALMFCSTSRAQQPAPVDEKPEEPKTGPINGKVVNDNGQPLAYASVSVRAFASQGQGRSTTTDSEGSFQVSGLDRAVYLISAYVPAYVSPPRDPDETQATYRVGDSVRLVLIKGGVITGTVTNSSGEPVIAVRVRASMIRDGNGQSSRYALSSRERTTDDRGVYRIYGLAAGTYVVSAGGGGNFSGFNVNAYDTDTPTFAPSSTRDTAVEINVRAGEEAANVDIRYRGEPGHVVSGIASGPSAATQPSGFSVILNPVFNGVSQSSNSSFQPPGSRGFAFYGIPDGDYDVIAQTSLGGGESATSESRRIKVRGADVTGIELTTKPLSAITGRVALEETKAPECKGKRRPLFTETLVTLWRNEKYAAKDQPQVIAPMGVSTLPDKQGDFALRNLAGGQYRFNARFFAKYWYLQSISLPPAAVAAAKGAPANRPTDATRNWTTLKPGDRLSGLTITLGEGAASFHGQIKLAEDQKLAPQLFVYLAPGEREKAEDVLRFFASQVSADGTFALNNLPPGRYWAIVKPAAESESSILSKLRLPDETDARAKLRGEAEVAKTEIEFRPCQNVTDYSLPLKPR